MAVGFLFPAIGFKKNNTTSHMKIHEYPGDFDFAEPRPDANKLHPVTLLSGIYLDAGLPLEAAAQAAIADYENLFDEASLCA